jgi:hypothetical protein
MHPHEAALALIGLFQEGESIADFQEGGFLEGGSDPFERKKERKKERKREVTGSKGCHRCCRCPNPQQLCA